MRVSASKLEEELTQEMTAPSVIRGARKANSPALRLPEFSVCCLRINKKVPRLTPSHLLLY